MSPGFMQRPGGALFTTLAAAAALLGLGWWLGSQTSQPQLAATVREASEETSRANLLAGEMASLEGRLKETRQRLELCQSRRTAAPRGKALVLKVGVASLLLNDKVVVTLARVEPEPPSAMVRLRVLGQPEAQASLRVGDLFPFTLGGAKRNLVLRQVGQGQALVSILD